jgi:hypothetical protein
VHDGRGLRRVVSCKPHWDVQGRTFEDVDGYRVALQNAAWRAEVPPGRAKPMMCEHFCASPNGRTIGPTRTGPLAATISGIQKWELRNPLRHYDHAGAERTEVRHHVPMRRLVLSDTHTGEEFGCTS